MINIPVAAETVLYIGSFPISNALMNAVLAMLVLVVASWYLKHFAKERPKRFQNAVEMVLEFLFGFFDRVTGDREKSKQFLPIAGTLFLFILLCNWMGLLPGVGSIGIWEEVHGKMELVPLFRSANSDLNLTLAMALLSVVGSHIIGIVALGFFTHTNKFFQFGTVWKALKKLKPIDILTALVEFVVGIIEFFGEIAKIASLSLRLFGNVFAGEVLLAVIASLVSYFIPLPFMAIELLVGVVQATVFAMLTLVYLTIMTKAPHGESHEEHGAAKHAEAAH
ncbi:MAG: F0F1 ATP synthase subunit A [Patescibacteria group bacterium]